MNLVRTGRGGVSALAFIAVACTSASPQLRSPAQQGQALFMEQGCYGCHTVRGAGTPIANDLTHVGGRYSEAELARRVLNPALHKPGAHMPKLALDDAQVKAIAAYLATLR